MKDQDFVKAIYIFSKQHLESSIFESSVSFNLKRGVATGYSFSDRTDFFWRITLSLLFFHGRWFFTGPVAAMYSFRGCIEQIFFDKKLPIKKGCVFGKPILYFRLFSGQSTYFTTLLATIRPLNSVSVFVIVKVAFIHSLNGTYIYSPRRTCRHPLFE